MVFENRLVFPDEDFRTEYRGDIKDNYTMHGTGTLTIQGKKTFTGEWNEGVC